MIIISGLIVLFSFIAPILFTQEDKLGLFNFSPDTGYVGDTIGGIMNPFIALAAVIVTGLAFYAQFQANQQVKDQFKLQQFESQFYEMLRLHKENVNEMEIEGYEFEEKVAWQHRVRDKKLTRGRKVFVTMKTELECIYLAIKKCYSLSVKHLKFESNLYTFPDGDDKHFFFLAYEVFFHGLDQFEESVENGKYGEYDASFLKSFNKELISLRKHHKLGGEKKLKYYLNDKTPNILKIWSAKNKSCMKEFPYLKLYFNYKPFSGHQSRLGHYYRHLIATVGLVVKNDLLKYKDKREYLKLLRSQLSNHEFVLLYYNYLSTYGSKWENDKNSYLIDYRMLHNIQAELVLSEFNPFEKLKTIKDSFLFKNEEKYTDLLFELDDSSNSSLSIEENRNLKNRNS